MPLACPENESRTGAGNRGGGKPPFVEPQITKRKFHRLCRGGKSPKSSGAKLRIRLGLLYLRGWCLHLELLSGIPSSSLPSVEKSP